MSHIQNLVSKTLKVAAAASLMAIASMASAAGSLDGTKWNTVDDETNEVKSVVEFKEVDGVVHAKIIKVTDPKSQDAKCTKCEGELKNQPIIGLKFLFGFKSTNNKVWEGGKVADPESGKVYNGRITLDGDKLKLKGFIKIGFIELGRSQTWVRAQ